MSNKIEDEVASLRKQVKTLQAQLNKVAGSCETTKTPTQPKKFDLSKEAVTIIVIGASGDLARKKTYPALFALFRLDLLPKHANIIGYSRSKIEHNDFLKRISQEFADHPKAKAFLKLCVYHAGSYDKDEDYESLAKQASKLESKSGHEKRNRLFYLAIPPSLFGVVAGNIREHLFNDDGPGWNRLVVEKPFGRDMETFLELSNQLSMFAEHELYRIDHYLGKEMVQNLMVLRFANAFLQPVWNRFHVAAVVISFKEPFDVQGRGGYFDEFGIIRDVMQNHLLQILALVAMEPPLSMAAEDVRDEKTKTLRSVRALTKDDVVIGQYCGNDEHEAYRDHEDVPNDSKTPTFASAALYIDNERWRGVPFILKCGKALNERKAEVRIQFRDAAPLFGNAMARNELVLRVQPDAAVYMKIYTKVPGMTTKLAMRELDFTVGEHFENEVPEAYERLLYDVLRGDHSLFVREDELLAAWRIFSPLLHELESADGPEPVVYEYGSRGPPQSDELLKQHGFVYAKDSYSWAGKQKL